MRLFALADLHLSQTTDKPMDLFGPRWVQHAAKIEEHWQKLVTSQDYVLVPGDISWGMNLDEAKADLAFIHALPGQKILLKGNHDYWWQSLSKVQNLVAEEGFTSLHFLQNNAFLLPENLVICGSRLWLLPDDQRFKLNDRKILKREIARLRLSITAAKSLNPAGQFICMTHYPPLEKNLAPNVISNLLRSEGIREVVFGHIHHADSPYTFLRKEIDGIHFSLVAGDYLNFTPLQIYPQKEEEICPLA